MTNQLKRLALVILIVLLFGSTSKGFSQEGDKLGSWYVYNGFFNFSPKFELFAESQLRTWEPVSNIQTLFIRAFANYNLNQSFQLGIGQEYHNSWTFSENTDDKVKTNEYRFTLQGMLFQKIGRVSAQHRYRYEFRFLDESGRQRTRYRLQLGIPITSDKMAKGVWFATAGNEFLVNTRPEINLAQNRLYGMLGYQFSHSTHIQFGYMHIAQSNDDNLHRLQFFLTQKFNFSNQ